MKETEISPIQFLRSLNKYEEGIELLLGKTIKAIDVYEKDNGDEIYFICDDNNIFKMFHYQECCEYVALEDVNGYWNDLLDNPISLAEESTKSEDGDGYDIEDTLWTFYKLATVKGYVDLRWCGSSDCYSIEVEVIKLNETLTLEYMNKRNKHKDLRKTYTNDEKYSEHF